MSIRMNQEINKNISKNLTLIMQKVKIKCLYCDYYSIIYEYANHYYKCLEDNGEFNCWVCKVGKVKKDLLIPEED